MGQEMADGCVGGLVWGREEHAYRALWLVMVEYFMWPGLGCWDGCIPAIKYGTGLGRPECTRRSERAQQEGSKDLCIVLVVIMLLWRAPKASGKSG
jgi:hypothetical protein